VTAENCADYRAADAFIVGSHFKRDGHWENDVLPDRVHAFVACVGELKRER
jgi:predicted TIM-barrel enzyme